MVNGSGRGEPWVVEARFSGCRPITLRVDPGTRLAATS